MNTEEILDWVQTSKAIINIQQGPEALKTIVENGGQDALVNALHHKDGNEGLEGYWVEIALNDSCAGWAYRDRLVDAINDAFHVVTMFGLEMGYLDSTLRLVPTKDRGESWIGKRKYNFQTNKVHYLDDGKWY
jgi:hypothetical protein